MSIATELTALNTNLQAAKTAVTTKGGTVGNTGLAGLASEIATIPSGGGSDDFELPEPSSGECYLLLEIQGDTIDDIFVSSIQGNVTAMEFGTSENDSFVKDASIPDATISGQTASTTIPANKFVLRNSGVRQLVAKITTMNSAGNFWQCAALVKKIKSKAPYGVSTSNSYSTMNNLTEVEIMGGDYGTKFSRKCAGNNALEKAKVSNVSVTKCDYVFQQCYSLKNVELKSFTNTGTTSYSSMFDSCYSLNELPSLSITGATDVSSMFRYCFSLRYGDFRNWDFSAVTAMQNFLGNHYTGGTFRFSDTFPQSGIPGTGNVSLVSRDNNTSNQVLHIMFEGVQRVIPLSKSADSLFAGTYTYVYVPDALFAAYQADSNWGALDTAGRLKKLSEYPGTLPQ